MTDHEFEKLIEVTRAEGENQGRIQAEWIAMDSFGGRATRGENETARRIIQMIDDGDPEIYNTFPMYPDLSGEWANESSGPQMLDFLLGQADLELADDEKGDLFTEILDEYEMAFTTACEDKLYRMAKYQVG
jgi:hypothetical protein